MAGKITADACEYCFLDFDLNNHRAKLATAAAFVDATDSRYGFSSKDLRHLGGSEISRIPELVTTDHEWSEKSTECGGLETRPPAAGNRIIIRLFWDVAPLACENFATLCANGGAFPAGSKAKPAPIGESGKPMTYRGSVVHRVIPGFVLQGGDFVFGNGSGGESIFGNKKTFKDERAGLAMKHDKLGLLSMGNSGKNSNTSQFFFTLSEKTPQCDGKHVIFGEIQSGMEVLRAAETYGTSGGEPAVPITITDCGIYQPLGLPGAGYWYDQPDAESFTLTSPVFMVRPRVIVVAPSSSALQKFAVAMGSNVSIVEQVEASDDASNQAAQRRCQILLDHFSADLVVIAPACKAVKALLPRVPKSWQALDRDLTADKVFVEAKPVDALVAVRNSWMSERIHWQFDDNC